MSIRYVWRTSYTYLAPTLTLSPNQLKRDSTWPMSPCSSIRCIQNDFCACCTFDTNRAPILHQDSHYLQMNWIKHQLEPRHLGVPSGASKTISKPAVCLAQTVHLSCTDTNTISKLTKTRFHMTHVTLEFHRVRPKWFLRLCYIQHKPCTYPALRCIQHNKSHVTFISQVNQFTSEFNTIITTYIGK
jgi:hypothetical protein